MATCDQPSDLIQRIGYPPFQPHRVRIDSRIRTWRADEDEQPVAASVGRGLEESLFREIEAGAKLTRNPRASVGSVAFLVVAVLAGIIVPLYRVETLSRPEVLTRLYLQPPGGTGSTGSRVQAPTSAPSPAAVRIPSAMQNTQPATVAPPPAPAGSPAGVVGGIPGGMGGAAPIGALNEIIASTSVVPVAPKAPEPVPVKRIHVAGRVAEANLIRDVSPEYPPEAGRARIEGTVVLIAVIGKDGSVLDVRVENGLPILAQAAIQAVRQWRYKPYLINGEPVEVESRVTVNFTLGA